MQAIADHNRQWLESPALACFLPTAHLDSEYPNALTVLTTPELLAQWPGYEEFKVLLYGPNIKSFVRIQVIYTNLLDHCWIAFDRPRAPYLQVLNLERKVVDELLYLLLALSKFHLSSLWPRLRDSPDLPKPIVGKDQQVFTFHWNAFTDGQQLVDAQDYVHKLYTHDRDGLLGVLSMPAPTCLMNEPLSLVDRGVIEQRFEDVKALVREHYPDVLDLLQQSIFLKEIRYPDGTVLTRWMARLIICEVDIIARWLQEFDRREAVFRALNTAGVPRLDKLGPDVQRLIAGYSKASLSPEVMEEL